MRARGRLGRIGVTLAVMLTACGRRAAPERAALPRALPVSVLADSAPDVSLRAARFESARAPVRLTLVRIAPSRATPEPALPVPEPESPPLPGGSPDRLPTDDALRPPVPRSEARLRIAGARAGWVELDVLVDEDGAVAQARPAGGSGDTALVRAAIDAATRVRYRPATRAGRPVAVWCRQRFELGR